MTDQQDIDRIHKKHRRSAGGTCVGCNDRWPCDTQVMRMEAFEANARAEVLEERLNLLTTSDNRRTLGE